VSFLLIKLFSKLKSPLKDWSKLLFLLTTSKKHLFFLFIKNLIDLKLAYYLKNSISLKNKKKALNDIDVVVKKIRKKIKY